jgi:hypothetical protein
MGNESGSEEQGHSPERETDQEIKDRQNAELDQERTERAERLGHDIRREEKRTEEVRTESSPSEPDPADDDDESESDSESN